MATETSAVIPCVAAPEVDGGIRRALLRHMLVHRLTEERIMALYRQGRIAGSVYTGRGQEAVGAAAGTALGPDDVCAPLNREMSCHLARGVTVAHIFRNYLGRATGPTFGRDGNMHFGVPERGIFPLVSMLGDLCPVIVGAAFAFKRRNLKMWRGHLCLLQQLVPGRTHTGDLQRRLRIRFDQGGPGHTRLQFCNVFHLS